LSDPRWVSHSGSEFGIWSLRRPWIEGSDCLLSVLFKYTNFTVSYESGIDNVPRFDAHLEVYSANKTVRVQYDTPYVKGLPITMHICENDNGAYKETTIRKSYEDAYTLELKVFWEMAVEGKKPKTTAQDAALDLEVFAMAMKHFYTDRM
jgi:hypothetical protein